ncbi:MAG TPA: hypothetical protein DDZ80_07815 [Cyanobacteria bacterium UBA8803]|nr:hypothetical protein [Cyanobacteria bacterium UBA9273]HBL58414.1 hypothetical protein [Cyanobacteria bacterium UBA8803]
MIVRTFCHSVIATAILGLPASFFTANPLLAQEEELLTGTLAFTVENYTSSNLVEFYISPTMTEKWEGTNLQDRVGEVAPGQGAQITVDDNREDCLYDVMGEFANGEQAVEHQVDLCEINGGSYAFYGSNDRVFDVINHTNSIMEEFYFQPATEEDWGEDLLGSEVINPGESVSIPVDSDKCIYDFKAVFEDGDVLEEEADVCENNDITFEDKEE